MTERLRVTMLIKHFPTRQGGAERLLESLLPLLAERGADVSVISRERAGAPAVPADVPVVQVPARGGRELSAARYVAHSLRHIRRERPHVTHAHSLLSPTSVAVAARRLFGVPAVATVHGGGEGGEIDRLRALRRGGRPRLWALGRELDRIVVISEEIGRELTEVAIPASRQIAIPNGVDSRRFRPAEHDEQRAHRQELGLGDGPVVVFVGRLVPVKGIDVLLQAWRSVRARVPDAALVLIGDGPDRPWLADRRGADGIHAPGALQDVSPYHRAADVFVLPSFAEGLSIALLEAMASGLPVVATDVGATADVVGDAGTIVPARAPEALADALVALLVDEERRRRLGAKARQRVTDRYELGGTADKLMELYGALAANRR